MGFSAGGVGLRAVWALMAWRVVIVLLISMSVQNETNRVQYWGNGSTTTAYPVPFYFFESGDLRVVVTDAAGNDAELEEGGGYSVAGAGNENGGSVWTVSAVPATSRVTIYREVSAVQTTVYEENGEFPARTHERALDRQTMLNQQSARAFDRSLKVRESDGPKAAMTTVGNSVIGFGADLQPRTFTPPQLAVWLNLTQQVFGEGTKTWLTDSDRAAAVPDFLGQVGVQVSDSTIWVSSGTSAGSWTNPTSGIPDGGIATAKLANGVLSADSTGRAKMADSFISLAKLGEGIFTADSTGRGKFASGFVDSGLCASGLWNSLAPTGAVLQSVTVPLTGASDFSGIIPNDNTIPQQSEGSEILTATITPSTTSSKIRVSYLVHLAISAGGTIATALFRDSIVNAIFANMVWHYDNRVMTPVNSSYLDSPATTSAVTYKVRVGVASGSFTGYYNQLSTGQKFLGTTISHLLLEEIKG